jgi:hypothetical protein
MDPYGISRSPGIATIVRRALESFAHQQEGQLSAAFTQLSSRLEWLGADMD